MKIAGQRQHQPALPEAGVGGEDRLQRRRLVLGHRARQRQHRHLRGGGRGRRPRQGGGRHRPRAARAAREAASPTDELDRAKKAFIAEFVYEFDSQSALARRYAEGLLLGLTIEQVNDWPAAIAKVTAEDVQRVAAKHFDIRHSVTGRLIPTPPEPENTAVLKPVADKP